MNSAERIRAEQLRREASGSATGEKLKGEKGLPGWVDEILGANPVQHFENRLKDWKAGGYGGMKASGEGLYKAGRLGLTAASLLPWLPVAQGAIEGAQNGFMGGAVQGGAALAGGLALQALVPIPGVSFAIGAALGSGLGGSARQGLDSALSARESGVDNAVTRVAEILAPGFRTSRTAASEAAMVQSMDPGLMAIRSEQNRRASEMAEHQRMMALANAAGNYGGGF